MFPFGLHDSPNYEPHEVQEVQEQPVVELKPFKDFLYDIGYRESTNRYNVVNEFGYLGKYQFSLSTVQFLGFKVNKAEFLNDHKLQETVMVSYINYHQKYLEKYISKYDDSFFEVTKDGEKRTIRITESGIIAAAHLSGAGNVKKFFKSGGSLAIKDKLGTSLVEYLELFSGYKI